MSRIFFSAGEPSGDLHAANLIRQLKEAGERVETVGYGGPRMEAAGCRLHADLTELAVMWFLRTLANLDKFWGLASRADRYFRHHRPDAVVLVDYPGFNWWIARRAKVHQIPVFYYAPPQIWGWARWRVRKMRRLVDHVLCGLPFEHAWFQAHGCRSVYVGHPYFDELQQQRPDEEFIRQHRNPTRPLVTILPGSRTQEVESNLGTLVDAASRIRTAVPGVRFAVAAFRPRHAEIARRLARHAAVSPVIHAGRTPELIQSADCCLAVSGSVSLELLYHQKPTVILYRIRRPAYTIQRAFRKARYITLVNLLAAADPLARDVTLTDQGHHEAERALFPEYLTWEDKSAEIAGHVIRWLTDPSDRKHRVAELARLKARVAQGGAAARAARYILQSLARPASVPPPHFQPAAQTLRTEG